eukprot:gnl/TRDRNA2_/TRDRNA2_203698_c0_seq1.p1 gnl/TRDRNA2_/TRDRNA2_203698_c0~~gnl/TRDRNA2_/TRDRNA2_203698_c0_seq1.p1  ORF type:complete len:229 (-),score=26.12 gnl/TRDRNA2_/TRDRNA2_203698_c0_seq1:88-750(-)
MIADLGADGVLEHIFFAAVAIQTVLFLYYCILAGGGNWRALSNASDIASLALVEKSADSIEELLEHEKATAEGQIVGEKTYSHIHKKGHKAVASPVVVHLIAKTMVEAAPALLFTTSLLSVTWDVLPITERVQVMISVASSLNQCCQSIINVVRKCPATFSGAFPIVIVTAVVGLSMVTLWGIWHCDSHVLAAHTSLKKMRSKRYGTAMRNVTSLQCISG